MSDTATSLRKTLVEIDRLILEILLPATALDHDSLHRVSSLEHARTAAQRLLLAAEAEESKVGA